MTGKTVRRQAQDRQPQMPPWLQYGVIIHPRDYEQAFWKSETHKVWSLHVDFQGVCFMLLNCSFYMLYLAIATASSSTFFMCTACITSLLTSGAQYIWMTTDINSYYCWRPLVVPAQRLLWLTSVIGSIFAARVTSPRMDARQKLQSQLWPPNGPFTCITYGQALVFSSFAMPSLVHGCAMPLPFVAQALIHMLATSVLIVYHAPTAVALLDFQPSHPYQAACQAMNVLGGVLEGAVVGPAVDFTAHSKVCEAHAQPMLVAFLIILLAFIIPVYFSYRLERCAKQAFLRPILRHQQFQALLQLLHETEGGTDQGTDQAQLAEELAQELAAGSADGTFSSGPQVHVTTHGDGIEVVGSVQSPRDINPLVSVRFHLGDACMLTVAAMFAWMMLQMASSNLMSVMHQL